MLTVRNHISRYLSLSSLMVLAALVFGTAAQATELRLPKPNISPEEVVRIQLAALMENDTPNQDFGIRQTWAFAHPDNRQVTGPIDRFIEMLKKPAYAPLINHRRHTVTEQNVATTWVQFKVMMEDEGGRVLAFAWVVKKVEGGIFDDCWMTSAVSAPVLAGQGS